MSGESSFSADIAQACYEAVDSIAAKDIDPPFMTRDIEEQILSSETVQCELRRQQECISIISGLAAPSIDAAGHLRRLAHEQAERVFR